MTGISNGLLLDLTPQTLNSTHGCTPAGPTSSDGRRFALYNDHLATYVFPAAFLSANYDLVYTRWFVGGVSPMISVVIISKDEAGLDATLAEVTAQARASGAGRGRGGRRVRRPAGPHPAAARGRRSGG